MIQEVTNRKFQRGQVWSYHSRQGEENSRITIMQVDCIDGTQIVVHATISRLVMKTPPYGTISHIPFAEGTLAASVTELTNDRPYSADFDKDYKRWKEGVGNGSAGFSTILVQQFITQYEMIRMLSEAMMPCHEDDYDEYEIVRTLSETIMSYHERDYEAEAIQMLSETIMPYHEHDYE